MENEQTDNEPTGSASDNLKSWIERAKRAHELVEAIDFQKVTSHEGEELQKLKAVNNALETLSNGGDVDLVEGVDEMVEPLSPEEQTKIQLATQLSAAGWGQQMGRFLWQQGSTSELRPSELIPHHTGLPSFDLCVAPAKATGNGSFALFISGQGVFGASLGDPPTKHQWHITQSLPHDSASQLLACLEHLSEKAFD